MAGTTASDFMTERGPAIYTKRLLNVDPDHGVVLTVPYQVNEVQLHWESGEVVGSIQGMREGSERVYFTADGATEAISVARAANQPIMTVFPPGDTATNVSIIAT